MKTMFLAAVALVGFALSPTANAQAPVTYSVIKVSASIPSVVQAADNASLFKFPITTKTLINIALNQDIATPVPKNIVLGFAGDFAAFGHNTPTPTAPVKLVVFDTTPPGTKLKTIAVASNRNVVENRVLASTFKRVAVSTLTFQDTSGGATVGAFTGGSLQIGGTLTRKPNGVATPQNLSVNSVTSVVGTINLFFTKGTTGGSGTFVVPKGSLKATGKIVGTFTE